MNKVFFTFFCFLFLTVTPVFSQNTELPNILRKIRNSLPELIDSETGAMDAAGNYVDTQNGLPGLNCAGFAKFIADGFYSPIKKQQGKTETNMSVTKLRVRNMDLRGDDFTSKWEWERDPYFGLDWTRNIAQELGKIRQDGFREHEAHDVRDKSVWKYMEDKGYPSEYVEDILKKQTEKNPNRWYLGSINSWYGNEPSLWQHHHIVCFFPYFDKDNNFTVVVFERNQETSIKSLLRRYPDSFTHLVWLSLEKPFQLPAIR